MIYITQECLFVKCLLRSVGYLLLIFFSVNYRYLNHVSSHINIKLLVI